MDVDSGHSGDDSREDNPSALGKRVLLARQTIRFTPEPEWVGLLLWERVEMVHSVEGLVTVAEQPMKVGM